MAPEVLQGTPFMTAKQSWSWWAGKEPRGWLDPGPQPSSSKKHQVFVEHSLETASLNGCPDSHGKIPAAIFIWNFESMATSAFQKRSWEISLNPEKQGFIFSIFESKLSKISYNNYIKFPSYIVEK